MNNEQIIKKFPSQFTWYYINKDGTIKSFIVNGGYAAYTLSKVFMLYKTFEEANNALKEFNNVFNIFKLKD